MVSRMGSVARFSSAMVQRTAETKRDGTIKVNATLDIFFNLENRCQSKKNIDKLEINDNTFIYDQFPILDKQKQFYESNRQSRENDNNNFQESVFFKAENITPLSLDDPKLCRDGPITELECINVINRFKKIKRQVPTVFLLNSTNFSGPSFEPKCYQVLILPFKADYSRSVDTEVLFLSSPKRQRQIIIKEFTTDFVIGCRL